MLFTSGIKVQKRDIAPTLIFFNNWLSLNVGLFLRVNWKPEIVHVHN